jgi:aminoglycoside 3-N-acetyltransferase
VIDAAPDPTEFRTRKSLAEDLSALGVESGETLLVHSSLRSLGWVCGGATAVVQALLDVLGSAGTLVVPAQSANNRDPSTWTYPVVPAALWATIRQHLPGYDPALTPSHRMGAISERVRTWPGAVRSEHPQTSFAAIGALAADIVDDHALESQLGERSPLARLEEVGARILLLGVGFDRCTAFHLGEYRVPFPPSRQIGCAVMGPWGRQWITYTAVDLDDADFAELGDSFEAQTAAVTIGRVGSATSRLLSLPEAVEFATKWFLGRRRRVGPFQ